MSQAPRRSDDSAATASTRIELTGLFAMMLGVWYPRNYVVAAIEPGRRTAAIEALLSAGFGRNAIRHEEGTRVIQIRKDIAAQRTPLQRVAATLSTAITDEGLMSQQYFDAAEAGASLIAVLSPEPHLVTEAGRILAASGGRHVRHYGDKMIADL